MNVMSLGGNCTSLLILGAARIPGPVDNWNAARGFLGVESLFTNFREQIESGNFNTRKREKNFKTDSDTIFSYGNYESFHIDMRKEKSVKDVLARHDRLMSFRKRVCEEDDCWFSYSLVKADIAKDNTINPEVLSALDSIKKFFPPEKLIFIGCRQTKFDHSYFDFHLDKVPKQINYIELLNVAFNSSKEHILENQKIFIERLKQIAKIVEGTKHAR